MMAHLESIATGGLGYTLTEQIQLYSADAMAERTAALLDQCVIEDGVDATSTRSRVHPTGVGSRWPCLSPVERYKDRKSVGCVPLQWSVQRFTDPKLRREDGIVRSSGAHRRCPTTIR